MAHCVETPNNIMTFILTVHIEGPATKDEIRDNLENLLQRGFNEGLISDGIEDSSAVNFEIE